jgi:hypothetical protein
MRREWELRLDRHWVGFARALKLAPDLLLGSPLGGSSHPASLKRGRWLALARAAGSASPGPGRRPVISGRDPDPTPPPGLGSPSPGFRRSWPDLYPWLVAEMVT